MVVRVLPIFDCNSDGDSSKWPTANKGYKRNDEYFLQRIANDYWAKDRDHNDLGGPPSSAIWRLDRLPDGYAGFEKSRPDLKHVDRYLYGHPRGQFRSLAEFYPHFKHLMDNGGPIGCQCRVCSGNKRTSTGGVNSGSNGTRSVSPARTSHYFSQAQTESNAPQKAPPVPHSNTTARPTGVPLLSQGRLSSPTPPRAPRKQTDEDGTTDIFRTLLDELKAADDDVVIDRKIVEATSPDWRVGHGLLKELLDDWRSQPRFTPRTGELVLFASDLKAEETLFWDEDLHTWRKAEQDAGILLALPKWEAGVITQTPLQRIDAADLTNIPNTKDNVVNSGYRVEPLSKTGNDDKRYAKQHRYLPLHGIRPLAYWQDCLHDLPEADWHPTVKHALSVTNTFCVIGRNRFKAVRDELSGSQATVFCRGAYIGSELITVGDAVRLFPNPDEQKSNEVTDILVVTAIKLRLVNIDDAGDDDWDGGRPYNVCLHVSGKAFTLDRKRSFDGVGKIPIPPDSDLLPPGLEGYGQWYHFTDPKRTAARLEVPYTRVFGRVQESVALEAWFQAPAPKSPQNGIQRFRKPAVATGYKRLSRGLSGLVQARAYAYAEDPRIDKAAGKCWFWADTRVEALDLHEVNNRFVGPKDDTRTKEQMSGWRKALKALDGSKHGLAAYHAERVKREEESKKEKQGLAAGSYGMVGAALTMLDGTSGSDTDETRQHADDADADHDMVDVGEDGDDMDEDDEEDDLAATEAEGDVPVMNKDGVIELSDDDD